MIYELSFQAILNASLQSVFKAFSSPQHLSRWCAPNNLNVLKFIGKIQKNEDFRLVMQGADGFQQSIIGTLHSVVEERQITFSCRWEDTNDHTKVVIDFSSLDNDATNINVKHTGFRTKNDMLQQQFAWLDCFEKLSIYLLEYTELTSRPGTTTVVFDNMSNASPT